jgi:aminoglycoside phosphotransferase (APT) family kinase protein
MDAVGRALAELHRQPGTGLPTLTAAVQLKALRRRAAWLDRLDPGLEGRAGELALRLGERLEREQGDLVALHGDFILAQVLLDGGDVALVDLDEARLGRPTVDLAVFVSQLERRAMLGELAPDRCAVLRGAFLEGYAAHARRAIDDRALETQIAAWLLKRASGMFRRREPDWRARIRATVALAERVADGARAQS